MQTNIQLTESEVKVAIREYIERNHKHYPIVNPWGMMEMTADNNRIDTVILTFIERHNDAEL